MFLGLGFGICLGFGMSQALSMVSLLEQLKGSQRKTFHNVRFMGDSTAVAIIRFYCLWFHSPPGSLGHGCFQATAAELSGCTSDCMVGTAYLIHPRGYSTA